MTTPAAEDAVDELDTDEICSDPYEEGCTASLDDGEGWNAACGNYADRQYAEEGKASGGSTTPTRGSGPGDPAVTTAPLVPAAHLNYLLVHRAHAREALVAEQLNPLRR